MYDDDAFSTTAFNTNSFSIPGGVVDWSNIDYSFTNDDRFPPIFCTAYGNTTANVATIARFPLVVHWQGNSFVWGTTLPAIKAINPSIKIVAYLMVMDEIVTEPVPGVTPGTQILWDLQDPSTYCVVDGVPVEVLIDGVMTKLRDCRSPLWQAAMLEAINAVLAAYPFDGFFFDNCSIFPACNPDPAVRAEMRLGLKSVIDAIRAAHPDLILIGNGGSYGVPGGAIVLSGLSGSETETDRARVVSEGTVRGYVRPIYNIFQDIANPVTEEDAVSGAQLAFANRMYYGIQPDFTTYPFPQTLQDIIDGYNVWAAANPLTPEIGDEFMNSYTAGRLDFLIDDVNGDVVGYKNKFGRERLGNFGTTVVVSGADPTGAIDATPYINLAAAAAAAEGGGVVVLPPGTYKVGGALLYSNVIYDNRGRTFISNGLDHMFKAVAGPLRSSGIIGGNYTGDAATTASFDGTIDCINLSAATSCDRATIFSLMYMEKFRCGYFGSQDDRDTRIDNNNFFGNGAGVYITNNHPYFTGENDFRANDFGITGTTLYDMNVTGQKFAYNNNGVVPQSGGIMQNCSFVNCTFAFHTVEAVELGLNCSITGGFLLAVSVGANAIGFKIIASGVTIQGVNVQSFGVPFTEGAIVFAAPVTLYNCDISGNMFSLFNVAGQRSIGTAIVHRTGTAQVTSSSITNNRMNLVLATDRFINQLGNGFIYSDISNNNIQNEALVQTADIITLAGGTVIGNTIIGNKFFVQTASTGKAIVAPVPRSWVKGNISRRTGGFTFTGADANTNGMAVGTVATTDNIHVP